MNKAKHKMSWDLSFLKIFKKIHSNLKNFFNLFKKHSKKLI